MSAPRFWNAVGVANDMVRKLEASACFPVLPMVIGMSTNKTVGYCSELTQRRWGGQQGKALAERIEMLSGPGAEQRSEAHARLRSLGAACAATDFARDDQRADTAFGEVVVGRNPRHGHKHKEFG